LRASSSSDGWSRKAKIALPHRWLANRLPAWPENITAMPNCFAGKTSHDADTMPRHFLTRS
jgi:hypothetical protein